MTGMLVPDFWADSETTPARSKVTLVQWLLKHRISGHPADMAAAADGAWPPAEQDDGGKRKGYLADIW